MNSILSRVRFFLDLFGDGEPRIVLLALYWLQLIILSSYIIWLITRKNSAVAVNAVTGVAVLVSAVGMHFCGISALIAMSVLNLVVATIVELSLFRK